jgi:hypothetical protein
MMLTLLDNLFARKKPKKAAAATRAPGAAKDGASIRMSSDWATARRRLGEIGARRVLIHGDGAALAAAKDALPGVTLVWGSHALADVKAGASLAEDLDWAKLDAAVCAGNELAGRFRQSLRLMLASDATRPVLWVGDGFEFCGGTLSAPQEADEVEGLLFNHFQEFFGVKDPLQFRIEIYHGPEVKRVYRILEPNQSMVLRLSDFFPQRQYPTSLAAFVEHPILTRERHFRLRLCADVFWRDSFTTLHSAHEFGRSPTHKVEFRAPAWMVREGEIALTIPNFERNADAAHEIETTAAGDGRILPRDTGSFLQQSTLARNGSAENSFLGWRYRGYGGSNWFALETEGALAAGHRGSIAGNHHVSCPIADRPDFAASAEEVLRFRTLQDEGYLLEPYAVPLASPNDELEFGFDSDAANPALPHLRIDYFDAAGAHLGHQMLTKTKAGPLFAADLLAGWDNPARARASLAFISNDFAKAALRMKGFKPMTNLVVRNRRTQDRDFTEFQSCWRNLGAAVPGFPHWLTDQLAVVGRTNVFGRARCDKSLRTGVVTVHGSGRLGYRGQARAEFIVINNAGQRRSADITLPAFTSRFVWLDEIIPDLARHLGPSANGALLVQSADADLNCQIVTTSPAGAVSLQHLWGY